MVSCNFLRNQSYKILQLFTYLEASSPINETSQRKGFDTIRKTQCVRTYRSKEKWLGKVGWGGRIRTYGTRYQKPMPYHLATPQSV